MFSAILVFPRPFIFVSVFYVLSTSGKIGRVDCAISISVSLIRMFLIYWVLYFSFFYVFPFSLLPGGVTLKANNALLNPIVELL